jgi:hypothetical protein
VICPGCAGNLKWDDGAYCQRCMFVPEPSATAVPEAPAQVPEGGAGWKLDPVGLWCVDCEHVLPLSVLRAMLATQDLSIIGAADRALLDDIHARMREELAREKP